MILGIGEIMERPNELIKRLKIGCDLSIKEKFDVYWYIISLEKQLEEVKNRVKGGSND